MDFKCQETSLGSRAALFLRRVFLFVLLHNDHFPLSGKNLVTLQHFKNSFLVQQACFIRVTQYVYDYRRGFKRTFFFLICKGMCNPSIYLKEGTSPIVCVFT